MKRFSVTLREPMSSLQKLQKEIRMNGFDLYSKAGVKRNEMLKSWTAQFENGFTLDINIYPGEEYETGYIDLVVFDEAGQECTCALADSDVVMGQFEITFDKMEYLVRLLPKEDEQYVFINRNIYNPDMGAEMCHTLAVDASWLSYYLWENEEEGKRTLAEYLNEYTSEDVEAWYSAAVLEGAVAFSFSLGEKKLIWGQDDEWRAQALLGLMEKLEVSPAQMKSFLQADINETG